MQYCAHDPGYDLKRTYQHNFLISMALVYGGVIALAALYLVIAGSRPSLVTLDILGDGTGPGNAGPELAQLIPGRLHERGIPLSQNEPDSVPSGLFALGRKIRIIRDNYPAVPAVESFTGAVSEILAPDEPQGSGPDDSPGSIDGLSGSGNVDYGLPTGPVPVIRYSPHFSPSPGGGEGNFKRDRPLRIHLAELRWPSQTPTKMICEATVELTFKADGILNWRILEINTDGKYQAFLPGFKKELIQALYRTWFEPARQGGVKVEQRVTLHATFCPSCDPVAWAEQGNMEVFLKK